MFYVIVHFLLLATSPSTFALFLGFTLVPIGLSLARVKPNHNCHANMYVEMEGTNFLGRAGRMC